MASGARPLQEKMTLFWHGHFATSAVKVRDAYLMWRQNDLFRRLATGNWLEMLVAVAKDPAMLIWLDQAQSRKEHPNENFAREVMELFTLGEGHYTERDVTEAARALTGWSYDRMTQSFVARPLWHDRGSQDHLRADGQLQWRRTSWRCWWPSPRPRGSSRRSCGTFSRASRPRSELADALAATFRSAGNNFKPLLRTMFLSEEFYSPSVIRNQVKSPVQWLVGSVRVLERPLPPPLVCVGLTRNLGQDLFAPPNVKGWDGGLSWITTNTLLARYNEAATLVQGDLAPAAGGMFAKRPNANRQFARRLSQVRIGAVDVDKLFTEKERADTEALVPALERRLLQGKLKPEQEKVLRDYLDGQQPAERRRHPQRHPAGDEHAGIPVDVKAVNELMRLHELHELNKMRMKDDITLQTRREFLRQTVLGGALSWTVPTFLANTFSALQAEAADQATQTPTGRDATILVVLQMAGGNDGLNTVVPFTNDYYHRARPRIGLAEAKVLKLNDDVGLHPAPDGLQGPV